MIYASCKQIQDNTNIYADALAMMEGRNYCIKHQKMPIELETSSFTLAKMVKGE